VEPVEEEDGHVGSPICPVRFVAPLSRYITLFALLAGDLHVFSARAVTMYPIRGNSGSASPCTPSCFRLSYILCLPSCWPTFCGSTRLEKVLFLTQHWFHLKRLPKNLGFVSVGVLIAHCRCSTGDRGQSRRSPPYTLLSGLDPDQAAHPCSGSTTARCTVVRQPRSRFALQETSAP